MTHFTPHYPIYDTVVKSSNSFLSHELKIVQSIPSSCLLSQICILSMSCNRKDYDLKIIHRNNPLLPKQTATGTVDSCTMHWYNPLLEISSISTKVTSKCCSLPISFKASTQSISTKLVSCSLDRCSP